MMNKHDKIVKNLEQRLNNSIINYDINSFVIYSTCNGCGEIDLYAKYNNKILLFEVKSSPNRYKKAEEQLRRAEKCCFKNYNVYKFFVYYNKNNNKGYSVVLVK